MKKAKLREYVPATNKLETLPDPTKAEQNNVEIYWLKSPHDGQSNEVACQAAAARRLKSEADVNPMPDLVEVPCSANSQQHSDNIPNTDSSSQPEINIDFEYSDERTILAPIDGWVTLVRQFDGIPTENGLTSRSYFWNTGLPFCPTNDLSQQESSSISTIGSAAATGVGAACLAMIGLFAYRKLCGTAQPAQQQQPRIQDRAEPAAPSNP